MKNAEELLPRGYLWETYHAHLFNGSYYMKYIVFSQLLSNISLLV